MSPHIYTDPEIGDSFCGSHSLGPVLKARDANMYVTRRMNAGEYPNLFVTQDFRDFSPLTELAPQKEFNWYVTELLRWPLPDGRMGEGILFKPENFDCEKKYPIIFHYYEKNAFNAHVFIHPELSEGAINIPSFVSNGYLVFVPDIEYKIGYPGESAYNSVVSAANYLAKMPWVDTRKMGLQGHSFGGFETNYIVSHSNLFVAAAPASAVSDLVTAYGELPKTWFYERRQGRIGATLWDRPDLYIANSPVFKADKVKAAVLIEYGRRDDSVVPYWQGLQWYNELKRLGRKVWMLGYEKEGHTIDEPKDQMDYSVRLAQFFDHFLKDAAAPKWMTNGENPGFELDTSR